MQSVKIDIGPCADPIRDQLIAQGVLSGKHRNSTAFDAAQEVLTRLWKAKISGSVSDKEFYVLRDKAVMCVITIAQNLSLDTANNS